MIQTANQMMWIYTNCIEPAKRVMASAIRSWRWLALSSACLISAGLMGCGSLGGTRARCNGCEGDFDMVHHRLGRCVFGRLRFGGVKPSGNSRECVIQGTVGGVGDSQRYPQHQSIRPLR